MTTPPSTLLIEDDDPFAETLTAAFEEADLVVERARDWQHGLELFRVGAHELVISDYNLPGSRYGLLLLLEVKVRMPSTKLVLISGALTEAAENELRPLGLIDAYFRKSSRIARDLLPWAREALQRADAPLDWQAFAAGHLHDPEVRRAQVHRIDSILRASLRNDA